MSSCPLAQAWRLTILATRLVVSSACLVSACAPGAGLAIKDFWKVDADTVVFVADPSLGNILNFNIGANIDLQVPPVSMNDGNPAQRKNNSGQEGDA